MSLHLLHNVIHIHRLHRPFIVFQIKYFSALWWSHWFCITKFVFSKYNLFCLFWGQFSFSWNGPFTFGRCHRVDAFFFLLCDVNQRIKQCCNMVAWFPFSETENDINVHNILFIMSDSPQQTTNWKKYICKINKILLLCSRRLVNNEQIQFKIYTMFQM